MTTQTPRCAIYTRKSTEAGLEQDFNSLHAQREACLAYIKSQKHEGWTLVPDEYDDGGFSGGSMERPALRKLLTDIENGKVNIVVVYKVDRLTRSLVDFARIIELLDKHGASFVSITQQFNTTTSMGRLTLNVLLSFAQFEREVTSERIRDKIAASKKKGIWMGGSPPLGYDVVDRGLVVNPAEAETIRDIFSSYLELGTVHRLKAKLNAAETRTKSWTSSSGRQIVGTAFTSGRLYHLLRNPVYIGLTAHRDQTYPGNHEPVVPAELWALVQAHLKEQFGERKNPTNRKSPCWLAGILVDEDGNRLTTTQTTKAGRLYYYYGTGNTDDAGSSGWSLPAKEIERVISSGFVQALQEARLILHGKEHHTANHDPALVRWVAKAHVWFEQLKTGERQSIEAIADAEKIDGGDVSRALPLAFLAPSIVQSIVAGKQPLEMTAEGLRRLRALPQIWSQQRRLLAFDSP